MDLFIERNIFRAPLPVSVGIWLQEGERAPDCQARPQDASCRGQRSCTELQTPHSRPGLQKRSKICHPAVQHMAKADTAVTASSDSHPKIRVHSGGQGTDGRADMSKLKARCKSL